MTPTVAVKVFDVAPAATVTEAGTVSNALLLDKETAAPPAGAALDRVTVQEDVALLASVVGLHDTVLINTGGSSVRGVLADDPL